MEDIDLRLHQELARLARISLSGSVGPYFTSHHQIEKDIAVVAIEIASDVAINIAHSQYDTHANCRLKRRASGRVAEKLTGAHFVALLAAQQRRKFIKYELHRSNNAQHSGQLHQNCELFLSLLSVRQ